MAEGGRSFIEGAHLKKKKEKEDLEISQQIDIIKRRNRNHARGPSQGVSHNQDLMKATESESLYGNQSNSFLLI